jgi:hypothetical protein
MLNGLPQIAARRRSIPNRRSVDVLIGAAIILLEAARAVSSLAY